jgi:gas vesicle protein
MANDRGNGFLWFLTGVGIGTALGVLYAPRSGKDTVEALRSTVDEAAASARTAVGKAKDSAQDLVEQGMNFVAGQKEQVKAAYEVGAQAYRAVTGTSAEAEEEAAKES